MGSSWLLWTSAVTILIVILVPDWIGYLISAAATTPGLAYTLTFLSGSIFILLVQRLFTTGIRAKGEDGAEGSKIYGLDHGRLHLQLPEAMWMNMGYWKYTGQHDGYSHHAKSLAEACRDLLIEVFATAGITKDYILAERHGGNTKRTCVIDLGFGCGDQSACLMGTDFGNYFNYYAGLTLDKKQYQFAVERFQPSSPPLIQSHGMDQSVKIDMFCADAAKPDLWHAELKTCILEVVQKTQERWVLALDTAYHFSPSRWPVIKYARNDLNASFAAFDLCLSPTASFCQKMLLRVLTTLMGAPWANFVTPDEYQDKLIEVGYAVDDVIVRDISGDVFGHLAAYLEQQDHKLRVLGLGLGPLNVARLMFSWWARSGVVRGVIVVAKQAQSQCGPAESR